MRFLAGELTNGASNPSVISVSSPHHDDHSRSSAGHSASQARFLSIGSPTPGSRLKWQEPQTLPESITMAREKSDEGDYQHDEDLETSPECSPGSYDGLSKVSRLSHISKLSRGARRSAKAKKTAGAKRSALAVDQRAKLSSGSPSPTFSPSEFEAQSRLAAHQPAAVRMEAERPPPRRVEMAGLARAPEAPSAPPRIVKTMLPVRSQLPAGSWGAEVMLQLGLDPSDHDVIGEIGPHPRTAPARASAGVSGRSQTKTDVAGFGVVSVSWAMGVSLCVVIVGAGHGV